MKTPYKVAIAIAGIGAAAAATVAVSSWDRAGPAVDSQTQDVVVYKSPT